MYTERLQKYNNKKFISDIFKLSLDSRFIKAILFITTARSQAESILL